MKVFMVPKVSLPVQLLLIVAFVIFGGQFLSPQAVQFFYSISLSLKECLGFMLPLMVFTFISAGLLSFKKNAPAVIAILVGCVFASNTLVPMISYLTCKTLLFSITNKVVINHLSSTTTTPWWTITLPRLFSPEHAIVLAVLTGFTLSVVSLPRAEQAIFRFKQTIEWIINNLFIPVLPLYVFGFLLEVHHKGVFSQLFSSYGKTLGLIIALQMLLIFFIYFIASKFELSRAIRYIHNAVPSYLTAFGTMSSAAAIPITAQCAYKNTKNKPLAEMATPILANIHLFGDAITIPVLALVTLFLFQGVIPTASTFFTFTIYFCITMLAASGIPGGGMIIMIPILKSVLGCTDAMISIMITLHLLQDGFGTGANVMGDGALMIIINKLLKKS